MKHPDSETLKELKDKAESDPLDALDAFTRLVVNPRSGPRKSGACPEPQEA